MEPLTDSPELLNAARRQALKVAQTLDRQRADLLRKRSELPEGLDLLNRGARAAEAVAAALEQAIARREGNREPMTDAAVTRASGDLVARADFQYRWRVYLFFIITFGYGVWSLYDGFVAWPRDNAQWKQMEERGQIPPQKLHNDAGLLLNRALGIGLTLISLPLFIWLMYRSRGEYRLANGALTAPGHPSIALDNIESLDKTRWDRKGIAVVEYKDASGAAKQLTLRDMVYQRSTTDQIVDRIEAHLASGDQTPAPSQP